MMTIKTITQISSNLKVSRKSDMQKRGAVRNLFNTEVDRAELQQQLTQLENENNQTLQSFKIDSVIGVIDSASEDQTRKLKRLPICLESESDDDSGDEPPATREVFPDDIPAAAASQQPSSSKKSEVKLIQQRIPLAKGQKTLKGTSNVTSSAVPK